MLLSVAAAVCWTACDGGSSGKPPAQTNSTSGNPLTAPVDYLGAAGKAKTLAEKTVDLAMINQAIQMFVAEESRYPKSLEELVQQKLLTEVPKAPYGTKIEYDPATGKVRIVKLP